MTTAAPRTLRHAVSALSPRTSSATSLPLSGYDKRLMLFAGRSNPELAAKIANKLGLELGGVGGAAVHRPGEGQRPRLGADDVEPGGLRDHARVEVRVLQQRGESAHPAVLLAGDEHDLSAAAGGRYTADMEELARAT